MIDVPCHPQAHRPGWMAAGARGSARSKRVAAAASGWRLTVPVACMLCVLSGSLMIHGCCVVVRSDTHESAHTPPGKAPSRPTGASLHVVSYSPIHGVRGGRPFRSWAAVNQQCRRGLASVPLMPSMIRSNQPAVTGAVCRLCGAYIYIYIGRRGGGTLYTVGARSLQRSGVKYANYFRREEPPQNKTALATARGTWWSTGTRVVFAISMRRCAKEISIAPADAAENARLVA